MVGRKIVLVAPTPGSIVHGKCRVIDGDTISINGFHIRLAGIDAPELDHPWGQRSKWALVGLCKGQQVTAQLLPELSYDRLVAQCFLPDGRDLAAEMVRIGMALDWATFSGGKYRHLEPPNARQQLWLAAARQLGPAAWEKALASLRPTTASVPVPVPVPVAVSVSRPAPPVAVVRPGRPEYRPARYVPQRKPVPRWPGWILGSALLALLVGCSMTGRSPEPARPAVSAPVAKPAATPTVVAVPPVVAAPPVIEQQPVSAYVVTAPALNVRERPSGGGAVMTQLFEGTTVVEEAIAGNWIGIALEDGRTGWVHRDYLRPAAP